MRLRKVKGAVETVHESNFVVKDAAVYKGKWNTLFKNDNPIHVEFGTGKGKFISTLALQNPNINYIGIERYDSVLVRALEKVDSLENPPSNLYFLCADAKNAEEYFADGEISEIYLNFSDPWPKARHAKRRLTSPFFMSIYNKLLSSSGSVCFKTDNRDLFDYSVDSIKECGWTLENVCYDLHNSEFAENNVMTEYEEKFSAKGNPIFRLVAKHK